MLNIVAGHILEDEPTQDKFFAVEEDVETQKGRAEYVPKFLEDFTNAKVLSTKPNILIGTSNNELTQIASNYTDTSLCVYDVFKKNNFDKFRKKMVAINILLRDTQEEAEEFMSQFDNQRIKDYTLYGTKQNIIDKLLTLENDGATDVMISNFYIDPIYKNIHEMVKEIVSTGQSDHNRV
jgi:hypothetical protein